MFWHPSIHLNVYISLSDVFIERTMRSLQLRDARHRWAEEEQRLDEEELEAFEELERLENELKVKLERRERDETESQRQFFGKQRHRT